MKADLSLNPAARILAAAVGKAHSLGIHVKISVVDADPNLKSFSQMDGVLFEAIDVAVRKARTARLFEMESGDLAALSQPGGPRFDVEQRRVGLITFHGSALIKSTNREAIGASGVSGVTAESDRAVVLAGAAMWDPTSSITPSSRAR